ncbi:MAG: polymer-forming cytoskeletal protein [Pseudomonadota bacterium]
MFSKSKITDTPSAPKSDDSSKTSATVTSPSSAASPKSDTSAGSSASFQPPKAKPSPSLLSSDLNIKGNVTSSGDIQIEGTIEGDVRAHLLTVGESATIHGEVIADDVVVNGRVIGRVRGLKVRLTSSARVEGDIVHKTIAIESGAHFEGSVQREEDPLGEAGEKRSARKPLPEPAMANDD